MNKAGSEAARFIVSAFQSVWSLELLLLLKRSTDQPLSREELVAALRASDSIVSQSVDALVVAGLVIEEGGQVRYAPASADLEMRVQETEEFYRARPNAVRRLIALGTAGSLAAFSDAFKFGGDK
ncbi:MAG: hypothetical protein ABI422_05455 [Sphingomicrobium sp.]